MEEICSICQKVLEMTEMLDEHIFLYVYYFFAEKLHDSDHESDKDKASTISDGM